METSMGFLPCFSPNPKPKPQSCQSCPVPLAQFIIYHSTRKKPQGPLLIWELPSSLLKHMSFEGCGGREASFPWAKSWGEFDHLTTCSKRYKWKVFIFNNQGTHFHPFSTSMITGGRVRSSCIRWQRVFERTFVFLASPQNLLGLTNLLG